MMRLALFSIVLSVLCGCFSSQRQEESVTIREEVKTGTENGKPVSVRTVSKEQSQSAEKSTAGVDVQAAIEAALAAATGRFGDMLAAAKPAPLDLSPLLGAIKENRTDLGPLLAKFESKPKTDDGTDWGTLLGAGLALATSTYGGAKVLENRKLRKDKDSLSRELCDVALLVDPAKAPSRTTKAKT